MEYIDLGLPSGNLWAACNVGATTPEKSGNYYSYKDALEIQTKEELLPTKENFQELIDYCNWEYQNIEYKITGPNSNKIFLPAAGLFTNSKFYYVGLHGTYWSSTYKKSTDGGYILFLNKNEYFVTCGFDYKRPIRLIKKKNNMEKRKIEINLDTAKEWYNSNNESLKIIALQAFTEEELKNSLPKTWEEWTIQNIRKDVYYIDDFSKIKYTTLINSSSKCKNSLNTKEDCEAHLALIQLHVLRDAYRDYYQKGWKPDWTNTKEYKFCIVFYKQKADLTYQSGEERFLSFPTDKLARQFLYNFKDLIEKAKDLI